MGRWIKVYMTLLDPQHELHPMARGEAACRAFAWIDLIGMARWRRYGGLDRGELRASVRFLATRWSWSPGKVGRFLEELETKEMIIREKMAGRQPSIIIICNYNTYQAKPDARGYTSGHADGHKVVEGRIRNNDPLEIAEAAVSEVFDYWRTRRAEVLGKTRGAPMKPSQHRLQTIRGRLVEGYTSDDLKRAIDGCLSKPFNVENGYTDIELICRDQKHVEQYIAYATNGNRPKSGRAWEPLE